MSIVAGYQEVSLGCIQGESTRVADSWRVGRGGDALGSVLRYNTN